MKKETYYQMTMITKPVKNKYDFNDKLPAGMIFFPLTSITEIVCSYFGIPVDETLYGCNRKMTFAKAKHIIRWMLMTHTVVRTSEYDYFEDYSVWEHSQMIRSARMVDGFLSIKDKEYTDNIDSIMLVVNKLRTTDPIFNSIFKK